MNFKIKSSISNTEYLNSENNIVSFKSNNEEWTITSINTDNSIYVISNHDNKYLYFDGTINMLLLKDLNDSEIEKFLWIIEPVGFNIYNVRSAKYRDFIWYVYDSNNSILNQPLMLTQDIKIQSKNIQFNIE